MYIFISHSSKDSEAAKKVCELLENNGHRCFLAPRDIRTGKEYAQELVEGIDRSDALILLLSENSNKSPHVLREIERAVSHGIPIVVYKMEEVQLTKSMEYFIMMHQWTNSDSDSDYGSILECINGLQLEQDKETVSVGKPRSKRHAYIKNCRIIAAVIVAVVIFLGGVLLINGQFGAAKEADNAGEQIRLGESITLGEYLGEPIVWKVLRFSDDKGTAVLISDKIITMKAYDVPDSGIYNSDGQNTFSASDEALKDLELQAYVRGNSDWENSNIRVWLNSDRAMVEYEGQAPESSASTEKKNGYNSEAGFLTNFSKEEQAVLTEMEVITSGNAMRAGESIVTRDKVFLLSADELEWFYEANVSLYAAPTQAAVEQDSTGWYQVYSLDYGVEDYYWWLREPVEGYSCQNYLVNNGYTEDTYITRTAANEGFGIRPAICVDVDALKELIGEK